MAGFAELLVAEKTKKKFLTLSRLNSRKPNEDIIYIKESFGGAVYIRLNEIKNTKVEFYNTNFTNCSSSQGSALYSANKIDLTLNMSHFKYI